MHGSGTLVPRLVYCRSCSILLSGLCIGEEDTIMSPMNARNLNNKSLGQRYLRTGRIMLLLSMEEI